MITQNDWLNTIYWSLAGQLPSGPAWDPITAQLTTALQGALPGLWCQYQGFSNIPFRQPKYTFLAATDMLLGQLRTQRDGTLGGVLRIQGSKLFTQLLELRKNIWQDILELEKRYRANASPCVGRIIAREPFPYTAPVLTTRNVGGATVVETRHESEWRPDPNWKGYSGWPTIFPPQVQQ